MPTTWAFYLGISGQAGAAQLAEDAVREADESGDLRTRIAARYGSVWVQAFCSVDPALGLRRAEEGIELVGDDLELGGSERSLGPPVDDRHSHLIRFGEASGNGQGPVQHERLA